MGAQTLRQRALIALARREYSRSELARKLAAFSETPDELESLLDDLERAQLLSSERFAESLANRRAARYGNERIGRELAQHDLPEAVIGAQMAQLRETEQERCRAVWQKRFGGAPQNLEERARQVRFLTARGFSSDVVRAVLKAAD